MASLILEKVTVKTDYPKANRTGGDPNSSDNEKIDADLGRAYADNHEGE